MALLLRNAELLEEVTRREKEAGIYPEADVDAFMKVRWLVEPALTPFFPSPPGIEF